LPFNTLPSYLQLEHLLYCESGESIDRVYRKLLPRNSALIDEPGSRMSGTTDAVSIRDRIRIWPPIGEKELLVLLHLLKAKRSGIAGMTELRRATGLSKAGFQRTLLQLMGRKYIQHAAGKFTLGSGVGGVFSVTLKGLVYAMAQHDGLWSVFDAVALLCKADCPPVLAQWRELSAASSRSARLLIAEATRFVTRTGTVWRNISSKSSSSLSQFPKLTKDASWKPFSGMPKQGNTF